MIILLNKRPEAGKPKSEGVTDMNFQQKMITASAILFAWGGNAMAAELDEVAFSQEARACIAAVNENANYDDAARVRHDVVELKRTFSGYVLEIETQVFGDASDAVMRKYSSYCFTENDNKPKTFRIDQVSDRSK
jgi:hypothetical protein